MNEVIFYLTLIHYDPSLITNVNQTDLIRLPSAQMELITNAMHNKRKDHIMSSKYLRTVKHRSFISSLI